MAKKTSDWKIVATEGATVDGRTISPQWINDMASAYSHDEYVALIWPEHSRSQWGGFSGKNWGVVEELKAEKRNGKLRLLAKITPNEHLLKANKEGQKLFTSIEPNPDYKGQGTCYLQGLAVTDSPASSGTTLLKFSTGSEEKTVEASQLEEIEFSECFASNPIANAFSTIAEYFKSGGELPSKQSTNQPEDIDVTKEELAEEMKTHFSSFKTNLLAELEQKFSVNQPESVPEELTPEVVKEESQQFSAQQFSQELEKQLKPLTEKVNGLENQFKELSQEKPGQRPGEEGAGETNVEAI